MLTEEEEETLCFGERGTASQIVYASRIPPTHLNTATHGPGQTIRHGPLGVPKMHLQIEMELKRGRGGLGGVEGQAFFTPVLEVTRTLLEVPGLVAGSDWT